MIGNYFREQYYLSLNYEDLKRLKEEMRSAGKDVQIICRNILCGNTFCVEIDLGSSTFFLTEIVPGALDVSMFIVRPTA